MGRPAFPAIYRTIFPGFKRHLTFFSAVTANSLVSGLLTKLLEKMIILEPRPPSFGVT
jgi:hypothetical protein